jgi:hypothetical protein
MRTIFQASPIFRHANTQVPSADSGVMRDRQVTLAVSSLREMSQEGNVNGIQRLLYAVAKRAIAWRICTSSLGTPRAA